MDILDRYLYRGISEEMHQALEGLKPKGISFTRPIRFGEGFKYGQGVTFGSSKNNAIISHQVDSGRFPTSGISTTPFLERAKLYATCKGKRAKGVIYKLDRELFAEKGIKEYRVKDFTRYPEIPEDDEVILAKEDNTSLPMEIVIEILL